MALMKPAAVEVEAEREAKDDDDVIRSITNPAYISINTVKTFLKIWRLSRFHEGTHNLHVWWYSIWTFDFEPFDRLFILNDEID